MSIQVIANRNTGATIFTGDFPSIRVAVQEAVNCGTKLDNANLAGLDLSGLNLSGGSFMGADFTGSNLNSTNFAGSNMNTSTFINTTTKGTNFSSANLFNATQPIGGFHPTAKTATANTTVKNYSHTFGQVS